MEADFEVQRTIMRAELTGLPLLAQESYWTIKVHVDKNRYYRWALERRQKMQRSECWRC